MDTRTFLDQLLQAGRELATQGRELASRGRDVAEQRLGIPEEGVSVFTQTKGGLMFDASIGGQKFTFEPK